VNSAAFFAFGVGNNGAKFSLLLFSPFAFYCARLLPASSTVYGTECENASSLKKSNNGNPIEGGVKGKRERKISFSFLSAFSD
jgi:hypothetical protein